MKIIMTGVDSKIITFNVDDCPSGHKYRTKPIVLHGWKKKYARQLVGYEHDAVPGYYFSKIVLRRFYDKKTSRPYDYANFAFGAKPIIDVLVEKGLLKADDPASLEEEYFQEYNPNIKVRYIRVTLSGLKKLEEKK